MAELFQSLRGFKDLLPPQSERTADFERLARRVLRLHGYREIRLPTLEWRDLFIKSTGETTDIVEKEMFELEDSAGRRMALRPEGTPGAVRAFLEHHLHQQGGRVKLFYIGSMFRAERPQAGRFREFGQVGAEHFGNPHPAADAESILALALLLDEAGLRGSWALHLNNLGCEEPDCRPAFRETLRAFLKSAAGELCDNCKRRMERNPLRVLDCKGDGPKLRDRLPRLEACGDCRVHFDGVKSLLGGLEFSEDPSLVRGLDYYTRTVFEFKSKGLGAQDAIAGGGRYDRLVRSMGGPDTPAVGWALGVERTLLAAASRESAEDEALPVYVAVQGGSAADGARQAERAALGLLQALRGARRDNAPSAARAEHDLARGGSGESAVPIRAEGGFFGHSLKAQLREAERLGARLAVIFGEREFLEKKCIIKDMTQKDVQETVPIDGALEHLRRRYFKEKGHGG